jgi:lysine 6-dehydrogenase
LFNSLIYYCQSKLLSFAPSRRLRARPGQHSLKSEVGKVKFLVLGAGRMGYAVAYDLVRSPRVEQVILADYEVARVNEALDRIGDPKITPVELDVSKAEDVVELMSRCDVAIGCVAYSHNYELTKCALKARCHFVDLGGNERVVTKQFLLDDLAKEQEITIIPDLGLAPGLVSILSVSAAESIDELYEIRMRVGGIPVEPEAPLNYSQVFSIDGLINEYVEDCSIIRDGKLYNVPALTDIEKIEFPKPFGQMEAFNTSGGASTMPDTYLGKVQHLDYKTIRYPGHCEQMAMLRHLGLMDSEATILPSGNKVAPRELLTQLLSEKLPKDEPDAVLLRVTVTGVRDRKPIQLVWECIDYNDQAQGLSAMMRMTAYPASVVAQMIARGDITQRGVLHQEKHIPVKLFLAELASRGVSLTMTERAPVQQGT